MKKIKLLFLFFCCLSASRLMAAQEIDIDTGTTDSSAVPTPTISAPTSAEVPAPTAIPQPVTAKSDEAVAEPTEVPSPVPTAVNGVLKMRDVYKAGLSYYKKQDFAKAIRYLKESLKIHDPYTPKFYYAEANAMLGVIYQFHIIDKGLAYQYYKAALHIDPKTATARKHIRELSEVKSSE